MAKLNSMKLISEAKTRFRGQANEIGSEEMVNKTKKGPKQ